MIEKIPVVILPLDDEDLDSKLPIAVSKGIDAIEIRIDQFKDLDEEYVIKAIKKIKEYPLGLIGTIRCKEEGGADIHDEKRVRLFELIAEYCDVLDIELNSKIAEKVIEIAHDEGKLALVSHHDFEKTPNEDYIQQIIDRGIKVGADIIKYAYKVNSFEDISRIMCVTSKNRDKKLVAIGMGELGKITRVAGGFFGSIFTYTFLGKSFAPGQIEAGKLIDELKFYKLRG